jgi:hypothetical protein
LLFNSYRHVSIGHNLFCSVGRNTNEKDLAGPLQTPGDIGERYNGPAQAFDTGRVLVCVRGDVLRFYHGRIYADMGDITITCNCVKGSRLCPEAQALYARIDALWRELQGVPIDDHRWAPYDEARDEFDIHLGNEPVGHTR